MSWKDGVQGVLAMAQVVIGAYLTYLMLVHVAATEFMWFYFVAYLVLAMIVAASISALRGSQTKDEIAKEVAKYFAKRQFGGDDK